MIKPPKGEVWIHVDHTANWDGEVWAVQSWHGEEYRYQTGSNVVIAGHSHTQFFGPLAKQPKAVVVVANGTVAKHGQILVVSGPVDVER